MSRVVTAAMKSRRSTSLAVTAVTAVMKSRRSISLGVTAVTAVFPALQIRAPPPPPPVSLLQTLLYRFHVGTEPFPPDSTFSRILKFRAGRKCDAFQDVLVST